jgi:protease II
MPYNYTIGNYTLFDNYTQVNWDYIDRENAHSDGLELNTGWVVNLLSSLSFQSTQVWNHMSQVYWSQETDNSTLYYRQQSETCSLSFNGSLVLDLPSGALLGCFEASDDLIAYSIDRTGDERFEVYLKINNTTLLVGSDAYYSCYFHGDWLYYNHVDAFFGIPSSIKRYHLHKSITETVYQEKDPSFTTELFKTNDQRFLFIKVKHLI